MRQTTILLALSTLLLLAACGPAAPTPTPEPTAVTGTEAVPDSGYPAPGSGYPAPGSGYPAPEGTPIISSEPLVIPQPSSAQVGNVHGVLLRITPDNTRKPIMGGIIYLGVPIKLDTGQEGLIELDKNVAPFTMTNALGEFVFVDVPPGRYGMMFETAEGAVLLRNPVDGTDMIIEVVGGQMIDMGELAYPLPE